MRDGDRWNERNKDQACSRMLTQTWFTEAPILNYTVQGVGFPAAFFYNPFRGICMMESINGLYKLMLDFIPTEGERAHTFFMLKVHTS